MISREGKEEKKKRQGSPKERRTAVAAAQKETPRELKHKPGKERFRNADVSREREGGGEGTLQSVGPRGFSQG